ncbi:YutD family protein [Paenibacillus ginsengihumi]|uniref:YutD family protein n=1 Tax=Paenibacillus ginsengihumi TaxID=431596 RepID=UPI000377BB57|nr:YutD family protein [Paenibacillus ginsengihumi]
MLSDKATDGTKNSVLIGNRQYHVLVDHKNGWKQEAFRERYSEVLERYDYIVGDWGYNQLRLRGFFRDGNPKAMKDSLFSTVQDYLNEYCNFGCAYFILEKVPGKTHRHSAVDAPHQPRAAATVFSADAGGGGQASAAQAAEGVSAPAYARTPGGQGAHRPHHHRPRADHSRHKPDAAQPGSKDEPRKG